MYEPVCPVNHIRYRERRGDVVATLSVTPIMKVRLLSLPAVIEGIQYILWMHVPIWHGNIPFLLHR